MLNVTIVERPRSTNLITLAKLKLSLGISDSASDERLSELIQDVSSAIPEFCGKHFARALVTEHLEGYGDTTLSLARTPIVRIDEMRLRDEIISASGYALADRNAGFVYRESRWTSTQPVEQWITSERVNMKGEQAWHSYYLGGYLMPEDDFTASGICSVASADKSFNLASDRFPLLAAGERIKFAGFNLGANNGEFTVVSRTKQKVVVEETVTTEAASGVVNITVSLPDNELKLPRDLQRIVIGELKDRYNAERRASDVSSKRIGDWAESYAQPTTTSFTNDSSGLTPKTQQALLRYIRVM